MEKGLIVVAVEERGEGMGRVRLSPAGDHTQKTIATAVAAQVVRRATVHTNGLSSYRQLPAYGLDHRPAVIGRGRSRAVTLLPRVHKVISLLKRWILGTHQGAVRGKHLAWYLEEFTFRFNRRHARHPTLLFQRLIQYGLDQPPLPYREIVGSPPHTQSLHLAVT